MNYEEFKIKVTGISQILGSCPMDKEIFSKYIATKADEANKDLAIGDVDNITDSADKVTGFYRDKDGSPILKGYQLKGFLKEAGKALKDQIQVAATASKVDNYVFILERDIPLFDADGNRIKNIDGYLERPLRAETMQGPRVSLAKSEYLNEGWNFTATIRVIESKGTAKSKPLDAELVKQMLDYGSLKGLLQWRNAGYGSFEYEVITE